MPESQRTPQDEISDEIARIYEARYGRDPEHITTHLLDDAVVCLLRDVNTPSQSALVDRGRGTSPPRSNEELQLGTVDEMRAAIKRSTRRSVRGYIPGFSAELDATTDVFLLEPGSD